MRRIVARVASEGSGNLPATAIAEARIAEVPMPTNSICSQTLTAAPNAP